MKKRNMILLIIATLVTAIFVFANLKPDYTNQLGIAIDENGEIYNSEDTPGYKVNTRLGSEGEKQASGWCLTGYIPCKSGDVIRFRDVGYFDFTGAGGSISRSGIFAYDSSFQKITHVYHNPSEPLDPSWIPVYGKDGDVVGVTMTDDWGDDIAYIRITCSNLNKRSVITINEEITGDAVLVFFQSIGSIFEGKKEDGPVVVISEENEENEETNSEQSATETPDTVAQETFGPEEIQIPEYWKEPLMEGVKAINTALCEAGSNKSAFLFYTDTHWNNSAQVSPILLKYLYRNTGINKTIFGGDIVYTEGTDYETMEYLWQWRSQLKDLPNHHSVVGNHDDGNNINNLFTEEYVYGYLLAPEETPDIVRGEKGVYYYIDSPAEKTRYLYLDTAYLSVCYHPEQLQFVVDALTCTPEGWHIVAVSHIWYDTNYHEANPTVGDLSRDGKLLLDMFDRYNSREKGNVDVNGTRVPFDFTGCGGKVEFCIGGHTHWDYDGRSANGIPVILCETDSYTVRSGLEFQPGTVTEASVNGVVADYSAGKIHVIRVGRGSSRVITYS